jgi:hypothetical protein
LGAPAGLLANDACMMTTYLNVAQHPEQGLELCVHVGHGWSTTRVPVRGSGGGVCEWSLCGLSCGGSRVMSESMGACRGGGMRVAGLARFYPGLLTQGQPHVVST